MSNIVKKKGKDERKTGEGEDVNGLEANTKTRKKEK